jgi:hypothetical protein
MLVASAAPDHSALMPSGFDHHQASAPAFSAAQAGAVVTAVFAASVSWQFVLVGGGALLGRVATSPRGVLAATLVSSFADRQAGVQDP